MATHYSPVHHGELTNHLTMYQQAMEQLGIAHDVIQLRTTTYVSEMGLKDLALPNVAKTDLEVAYLEQVEHYRVVLASKDVKVVVEQFLKDNQDKIASALFHGLIRLAFAVESHNLEEIARALAYFHVVAAPMALPQNSQITTEPLAAWTHLMDLRMATEIDFSHNATTAKIEQVLATQDLMDHLTQMDIGEETEKTIAYCIAKWYLTTRDFYVLHVVTGFYALLQLKPYIPEFDNWLKRFWQVAQVVSLITTERLPIIKMTVSPWSDTMAEAQQITDVHDVKLFYACKGLDDLFSLKILNKVAHILTHKYWGHDHHN